MPGLLREPFGVSRAQLEWTPLTQRKARDARMRTKGPWRPTTGERDTRMKARTKLRAGGRSVADREEGLPLPRVY